MSSSSTEKKLWEEYYSKSLEGAGQENEESLFWELADKDLVNCVREELETDEIDVLEAGCGSGATSIMLSKNLQVKKLTLLDISPSALEFAKKQNDCNSCSQVEYIEGDIFDLSRFKNAYDLVWNIGLIEHYSTFDIEKILTQMFNSVRPGGQLVVGIPNRKSPAVLKAALLGSKFGKKFLKWVKGYRNETEILYGDMEISKIISKVTNTKNVKIRYAGSSLFVGTPNPILKFHYSFLKLNRFKFLTVFILKKVS